MAARPTRLLVFPVLVVLAGAAVAHAQPKAVRVTAAKAEIRATTSRTSTLLAQPAEGTVLDVLGRENGWYKVSIPPGLRPRSTSPASGFIEASQVTPATAEVVKPRGAPVTPAARGAAPGAKQPMRVRAFGTLLYERFQASKSFEALYESAGAPVFGGGVDVSVGRRFFVQADVTFVQRTGERAFVFNNEVFRLGIRQQMSLTPIGVTAGYRQAGRKGFTPYAGGGVLIAFYSEDSELATDENVSKTSVGAQGIAGVEFRLSRLFSAAAEGGYRYIPGILGDSGVSKEYGEKNLGGLTVGVKILIGR